MVEVMVEKAVAAEAVEVAAVAKAVATRAAVAMQVASLVEVVATAAANCCRTAVEYSSSTRPSSFSTARTAARFRHQAR